MIMAFIPILQFIYDYPILTVYPYTTIYYDIFIMASAMFAIRTSYEYIRFAV